MYSVTAASRMSGVPPETLRAWERRYEVVQPRRDERGRRVYAVEDVDRLRLLRRGTELGHPISRLITLDEDELRHLGKQCPASEEQAPGSALVTRLLDAVTRYRVDECDEIFGLAATLLSPVALLDDVLTPAMRGTREAWHRGEITKAQEGLLCASARRTFGALIATYRRRADGPVMVLATLPGEHQDIGLMITALLAVTQGCDCIDLGSDVSVDDIIAGVQATDARCVSLSCVTRKPSCRVVPPLTDLCNRLPESCELWLGGSNACDLDAADLPDRCVRLAGTDALQERLNVLCAATP